MGGRRGGHGGNRRGRGMDRRSQGRFPNNRGQQKRDGAGKFNYGKEDENPQDTQQDWDDNVGEEKNGEVAMENNAGDAADTQQTESKADEEGGEDKKAEDEPPREKTEEELEAEKEAAYIGLDEYEKRRGKLDDDVSLSRRKVKNDEKQFACKKMKKKVEDTDMFDFSALKKAAQQPKKKGKKKKGQKIT